jgi:transposase
LFLLSHSPDFSPKEQARSKIKNTLRKAQVCTHEALVEAIGQALNAVSHQHALD